jgi:hypothetical protein
MKKLLAIAAFIEAATGLVLLAVPALVGWLLLGVELTGVSIPVARVCGIGLFSLGIACWPCAATSCAFLGMLAYSVLATLYLLYLALGGEWIGLLLWPAVVLHGVLTVLLARAWFKPQRG